MNHTTRRAAYVLQRRVHGQEQGEQPIFYQEEYMAKSRESSLYFTNESTRPIARSAAYVLLRRVHGQEQGEQPMFTKKST